MHHYASIADQLTAVHAGGPRPAVRVPWNEPGFIGQVLDAGALGVVVPMVNDVAAARRQSSLPAVMRPTAPGASVRSGR